MWDPYPLSGHEMWPATPSTAEEEEEEEQEEKDEWSKSLVRKKVAATRARAPIWCVRVQGGVWWGAISLLGL